jgi:hypothetical protein
MGSESQEQTKSKEKKKIKKKKKKGQKNPHNAINAHQNTALTDSPSSDSCCWTVRAPESHT